MNYPVIIAHRGESFEAPENTLSSINRAWEKGVKVVEIDIQLTKDKQIVVFHDTNTQRLSGIKKQIKNTTLNELKLLDIGSHKGAAWKGERIPTLNDVLKTIPANGKLIIEIKSNYKILEILKNELQQSQLSPSQIEIIAFNANTLAKAKQLMPQYTMLWLLNLDYTFPWWLYFCSKKQIIKKVNHLKLDGVNVFSGKLLNPSFISSFKNAGLLVYTWTVNNPKIAEQLIYSGIDGITTDRAHWMKLQLKHLL